MLMWAVVDPQPYTHQDTHTERQSQHIKKKKKVYKVLMLDAVKALISTVSIWNREKRPTG